MRSKQAGDFQFDLIEGRYRYPRMLQFSGRRYVDGGRLVFISILTVELTNMRVRRARRSKVGRSPG